ncbi:hypothetical protein C8Q70DRAFT_1036769 [Cubamyces menziesii]|nr:hypothetical protein C8Q70DRAFT_1036769 [Cubamyces menziesii]
MSVLKTIVTQSFSACTTVKSVLFAALIPTVLTSHSVNTPLPKVDEDVEGRHTAQVSDSTGSVGISLSICQQYI